MPPDVSSITYASLGVVLDAVTYGVSVNLLMIDQVDPAKQNVRDGRYQLRRPVLLLQRKEANLEADAVAEFALSAEGQAIIDEMFIRIFRRSTRIQGQAPHLDADNETLCPSPICFLPA